MKVLDLPLIGKWYDLLHSRVKKEEYREISAHWISRMFEKRYVDEYYKMTPKMAKFYAEHPEHLKELYNDGRLRFKITHVRTRRGYTKTCELREVESWRIGIGNKEWGAPEKDVIIVNYP